MIKTIEVKEVEKEGEVVRELNGGEAESAGPWGDICVGCSIRTL